MTIEDSAQPRDASPDRSVSPDEKRAALAAVLESRHLVKAPLLSSFLSYVCELSIEDETARITEQQIGVQVFRRPENYDPGEDNIVRNYARQLRRRLESFYEEEGRAAALRIEIPKGGYVAVFSRSTPGTMTVEAPAGSLEAVDEAQPASPASSPAAASALRKPDWVRLQLIALYALLACAALGFGVHRYMAARSPLHPLWKELFASDRDTIVVPADVAYVIVQQLSGRIFTLAEYESWSVVEQYDHNYTSFLKAQKYTSLLDLDAVARLERLPELVPDRFSARAAHSISIDDLSNDNVILLGSNFSNPWVSIFERNLNFRFVNNLQQGRSWIENTHPLPGESPIYENTTRNITHPTFAVIALVPNLNKSGHVLIIEGLDGSGTQAAVDSLFQSDQLKAVLKKATHADGTLGSFEVLLAATSLDASATGIHIIAER